MKIFRHKLFIFIFIPVFFTGISEDLLSGDLGPADFPSEAINSGPKSSHTAWCKQLGRNCVIVFDNEKMIVDNFKGIKREQFIDFRTSWDRNEMYYYVNYLNSENKKTTALFLFMNRKAAAYFGESLSRWYNQDPNPYPITY